mmetsp:Transcript_11751/g.25805  ORF Transcript_11751/g.25805 Transcript_11751/m.25805 type:complete len:202 (-) Transcript_11751:732-1337(-)
MAELPACRRLGLLISLSDFLTLAASPVSLRFGLYPSDVILSLLPLLLAERSSPAMSSLLLLSLVDDLLRLALDDPRRPPLPISPFLTTMDFAIARCCPPSLICGVARLKLDSRDFSSFIAKSLSKALKSDFLGKTMDWLNFRVSPRDRGAAVATADGPSSTVKDFLGASLVSDFLSEVSDFLWAVSDFLCASFSMALAPAE